MQQIKDILLKLDDNYWDMATPEILSRDAGRLSVLSCYLSAKTWESRKDEVISYFNLKMEETRIYLSEKAKKISEKDITDKMAEAIAKEETHELMLKRLESEIIAEKNKMLLNQVNKVIDSLRSRAYLLKREEQDMNKTASIIPSWWMSPEVMDELFD